MRGIWIAAFERIPRIPSNHSDARPGDEFGEYVRLAADIVAKRSGASRYSEIMARLRRLGRDYPVDEAMQHFSESWYDNPQQARYVLWRYEEHLARASGAGGTVDEQVRREIWQQRATDSIEHIFPQNPEAGGAWEGKMRDGEGAEQGHRDHVDRIGNLILLPIALNIEAKRRGFGEKKEIYARHNLRMIGEVREKSDWTLAEIEERERKLADWARAEWADHSVA